MTARTAILRPPVPGDTTAIARLLDQLGHPGDSDDIPRRVTAIVGDPDAAMWIAEVEGRVAGFGTALLIDAIHMNGRVAQLTSLVVDEALRGRGIGAQLVAEAERWARERGALRISLTSALHRRAAHAFYERIGYAQTGVRLAKDLA